MTDECGMICGMIATVKNQIHPDLIKKIQDDILVDFINEQSVRYRKHSSNAINEDQALAIGWFGVSIAQMFHDPDTREGFKQITELSDLENDLLIASIVKLRAEREKQYPGEHSD